MTNRPSNFEMVKEFNQAFGVMRGWDGPNIDLTMKLINEEVTEVYEELFNRGRYDKRSVAKEIADLLYVVYRAADVLAIPIDEVFREVHRSNMSKLGEDGKPVRRDDGKVLKGPNYSPANLEGIVDGDI